jgi:hypothetical protein
MKTKIILTAIFLAILPIISIGLTLNSIKDSQNIKSNAEIPMSNLTPPYARLIATGNSFKVGDEVLVHVLVNTNSVKTFENRFVINFDGKVLQLNPEDIENKNIYPVIDIESVTNKSIVFSIFVKNESGYSPVSIPLELEVATLHFHVIGNSKKETLIDLDGSRDASSIIAASPDPKENPTNILHSTEGANIIIE